MAVLVTPSPHVLEPRDASRVTTVDCLRGLAASAVVWFHLTQGNPDPHLPLWLRASGRHGWLGVEVFFVISGFVIPFVLRRANYRLKDYGPFVVRRIVRLDPPYFASILVAVGLAYASAAVPGFRGQPPAFSVPQLLSHVAYANGLLGFHAINVVYWSLSLEFQYYLLIGLAAPLLLSEKRIVRIGALAALSIAALALPNKLIVFSWFFLFELGILTFYFRGRMVSLSGYLAGVVLMAVGTHVTLGLATALVAVATTLLMAFVELRNRPLLFLGDISYSLYLIHVPVGGRIINGGSRLALGPAGWVLLTLAAFVVAVLVAYGFHLLVERPAREWATRIPYGNRRGRRERLLRVS
jgi:peptidoglycan/LPS O-acetylase OafA/YrhL